MNENLASTVLTSGINTAQTTIAVKNANDFPISGYYYATITPANTFPSTENSEIVLIKARANNIFTVERGARRTTAKSFQAGSLIYISVYGERTLKIGDIIMTMNNSPAYGRLFMDGGRYQEEDYQLLEIGRAHV